MKQVADLHHLALPMLLPGITIDTSPTDWYPIKQEQLARFDGITWVVRFGEVAAIYRGNAERLLPRLKPEAETTPPFA
jgi:hypothetical protein